MQNARLSQKHYALVILFTLAVSFCTMPSDIFAGGVHFGLGVDVPLPGTAVPPVMVSPPVVVMERTPPPPRVVVEQAPPVVIKRTPPIVVYEEPVVVERRSTVYYYPRLHEYHSPGEETEREYYRHRSRLSEDDELY